MFDCLFRYSNDRDNRNNSSRFDSSRNNYDSRDSRGGGGGYEIYDRRVPEDPARSETQPRELSALLINLERKPMTFFENNKNILHIASYSNVKF